MGISAIIRGTAAASLTAVLVACGGGGGGDGGGENTPAGALNSPPARAASLSQTGTEAAESVKSTVAGADLVAQQTAHPQGNFLPLNVFGGPSSSLAVSGESAPTRATVPGREQAQAVQTLACSSLFAVACSGSATVDTNLTSDVPVLPAGTYVAMSFNSLQWNVNGQSMSLQGALRMDYLTAFDLNASSLAGVRVQLTLSGLAGSAAGISFGPQSGVALLEVDALGRSSLTMDGRTFGGMTDVRVTDANNYGIGAGSVRGSHWADAAAHVDVRYSGWTVVGGRPVQGASAVVSAGADRIDITVLSTTAGATVYDVRITVAGSTRRFTVTATHVAGSPSVYSAVEVTG
jgi:hypothetical protein